MSTYRVGHHTFQWTNLHLAREETDPLRYEYDKLGSNVVKSLQFIHSQRKSASAEKTSSCLPFDMYATLKDHHGSDEELGSLWREVHTVPTGLTGLKLNAAKSSFTGTHPLTSLGSPSRASWVRTPPLRVSLKFWYALEGFRLRCSAVDC